MSAILVDSEFGNTARVAEAVAEGIGGHTPVIRVTRLQTPQEVLEVIEAHAPGLLVFGGPTMNRGMSPRLAAALEVAASHLRGVEVAVFDTRLHGPGLLMGAAAKRAAKRLEAAGARLLLPAEGFYVRRVPPSPGVRARLEDVVLSPCELERARAWGVHLSGAAGVARAA